MPDEVTGSAPTGTPTHPSAEPSQGSDRFAPIQAAYLFRRTGDYWSVAYEGVPVLLRDRRGLALIRQLLAQPFEERHVLDFIAPDREPGRGIAPSGHGLRTDGELADAGPGCDARARSEYRRRVAEIDSDLAEAEAVNDLGRLESLRGEREHLVRQLAYAFGLGGRPRPLGSAAERARINVRNSIVGALRAMEASAPALHAHLRLAIRTGTYCVYRPERAVAWVL